MSNLSPLLLLTLGELLLVTSIVSVGLILHAVVKKKRDRVSAHKLIGRIKQDESRRQDETRDLLGGHFGLQGESLDELVNKICHEEKLFYQKLINLYLKRDAAALEVLHVAFEGATEPYRTLQLPAAEGKPQRSELDGGDESGELKLLREQNERLSEELRITMDTMGRMLNEYSSMYSGGADAELDKEKLLDMFKAEAASRPTPEQAAEGSDQQADGGIGDRGKASAAADAEPAAAAAGDPAVATDVSDTGGTSDDLEDDLLSLDEIQEELKSGGKA